MIFDRTYVKNWYVVIKETSENNQNETSIAVYIWNAYALCSTTSTYMWLILTHVFLDQRGGNPSLR